MALNNSGLLVRYYVDEDASGTIPTQVLDSSGVGTALPLAITYGVDMFYTEASGNRGLYCQYQFPNDNKATTAALTAGNKVYDALHGSTTCTLEYVIDAVLYNNNGSRVFGLMNGDTGDGAFVWCGVESGSNGEVRINGAPKTSAIFKPHGRSVIHVVFDTDQAAQADRLRIYVDGLSVGTGGNSLSLSESLVMTDARIVMMNRGDMGRGFQGTVFYGAIYDEAFTAQRCSDHCDVLALDDDTPTPGLKFFWRCESTTFSGTDDYSAGDNTPTAVNSATIGTTNAVVGTNGLVYQNDYATYTFNPESIINILEGSFGAWVTFAASPAWNEGFKVLDAYDASETTNRIQLSVSGTASGTNDVILNLRHVTNGQQSVTYSGANLVADTPYFVVGRWDKANTRGRVEVYDSMMVLLGSAESTSLSTTQWPKGVDIDTFMTGGNSLMWSYVDNVFVSNTYSEPFQNTMYMGSYAYYNGGSPINVIRYVNSDSPDGGNGTTTSITGGDPNRAFRGIQYWNIARARDLRFFNEQETVFCATFGGAPDGSNVDMSSSWVTSEGCHLRITAATADLYKGYYSAEKYRLYCDGGGGPAFRVPNGGPLVYLDGIQIGIHTFPVSCVFDNNGSTRVLNCYLYCGPQTNAGGYHGLTYNFSQSVINPHAINNVIEGFTNTGRGIQHSAMGSTGYIYNNNIRNCAYGIDGHWQTQLLLKNNIVQDCSTACYTDSFHANSTHNVTDDGTGPATNLLNGVVQFRVPMWRFRVELSENDTIARGTGVDLSADAGLPFNTDVLGATRNATWDRGAWADPDPSLRTRYVNPHSTGGDGTTANLTGTDAAYASLNACLAAEQINLVTNNLILEVVCATEGNADTVVINAPTQTSWVTDPSRYVYIHAAVGHEATSQWSDAKYRIAGDASVESDHFLATDGSLGIRNLRVERLQFVMDTSGVLTGWGAKILILSPYVVPGEYTDNWVSGCYFKMTGDSTAAGSTYFTAIFANPGYIGKTHPCYFIYNNIFNCEASTPNWTTSLHAACRLEHRSRRAFFWNNTAVGNWRYAFAGAANDSYGVHYLFNNLADGVIMAFADGTYLAGDADYNATSHATLGYSAGANDRVSQTFTFASATDYALAASDTGAKGYGLTDPASGLFSDDINGATRTVPWDIGAVIFVPAVETTQQGWSIYYRGLTST